MNGFCRSDRSSKVTEMESDRRAAQVDVRPRPVVFVQGAFQTMPVPALKDVELRHWKLVSQPFDGQFYRACLQHKLAGLWMQSVLRNCESFARLVAEPGAGATTWARQWMLCHGQGPTPLQVLAGDESWLDIRIWQRHCDLARDNAKMGIATVCVLDWTGVVGVPLSNQTINRWAKPTNPLTVLLISRASFVSQNQTFEMSHPLRRSSDSHSACLRDSLTHAGQVVPCFSTEAADLVAHWSRGDFRQLVAWTRAALKWGASRGLCRLTEDDLRRLRGECLSVQWDASRWGAAQHSHQCQSAAA